MAGPSMLCRIAYPHQTPSFPLTPCETYMSLYENTTVDPIILKTLLTSSLPVSLSLDRSFFSRTFSPIPQSQSLFQKNLLLMTSSTCADKTEYSRLYVPNPPLSCACSLHGFRSATSNIFANALVSTGCSHILTWSTSSYDLNPVWRRKLSI